MEQIRRLTAGDNEVKEAIRGAAALLIGAGFAMLFFRYGADLGENWGDFPLFLVLAIPAVALYGFGLLAGLAGPRPWQPIPVVFGLLFALAALYQFVELLEGDTSSSLNTFWIFAVVAALAFLAGLRADVRYALLFAGVATLVSLLALFDELLPDGLAGDVGTFRGICILIALGLAAIGFVLIRRDASAGGRRGGELLTSAGLAFITGAGLASTIGLAPTLGPIPAPGLASPVGGNTSLFWDTVLLVGSVALIVAASRFDARGPGYVGALGLFLFIVIAGFDVDDPSPEPSVIGWPLVLLLLGAAALVVSFLGSVGVGALRRPGTAAASDTTAVQATAPTPAPPPTPAEPSATSPEDPASPPPPAGDPGSEDAPASPEDPPAEEDSPRA